MDLENHPNQIGNKYSGMTPEDLHALSSELATLTQIANNYKDRGARSEANAILYSVQKIEAVLNKVSGYGTSTTQKTS